MSFLAQAYLLERYGLRLTVDQLADVLCISKGTLYNWIAQGTCPIPTYQDMDGGKRYADFRDVADYMDTKRAEAARLQTSSDLPSG